MKLIMKYKAGFVLAFVAINMIGALKPGLAIANEVTVPVHRIFESGVGGKIGTIKIKQGAGQVEFRLNIHGMLPGRHAFHVHEKGNCGPGIKDGVMVPGLKAGGHYTRQGGHASHANHHHHKPHGDLPELVATKWGEIQSTIASSRLTLREIRGRSIMLHEHGENEEGKAVGGGQRYACGVIPK